MENFSHIEIQIVFECFKYIMRNFCCRNSENSCVFFLSPQNFYEKPAFDYPLNQMSVWLMLGNEGMERESNGSFCAPTPSAMVFGRSDGDRVAVTRDLALRQGYTLQFKVLTWKV